MNIKEAKQEIIRTVKAYTAKDSQGRYKIPSIHQRPLLLIGPPGIGKSAVLRQAASELQIGLVEYTMTHHTRQSAVGLPVLEKRMFQGKEYTVTEYTMSEILASVYDCMERTKKREGILFLDEINCVSETLAPTMLQFLQCKTFGSHKLPEGWVIVAAGNPPRYNKAVREFDMATLDRVKELEISADYTVWREYAAENGVHPAILAYLELKKENFYRISEGKEGLSFVTARGWEDLSRMIRVYEELDFPVTEELVCQYLSHKETAWEFTGFYVLCKEFREEISLEKLRKREKWEELAGAFQKAGFEERLVLVQLLSSALGEKAKAYQKEKAYLDGLKQCVKQIEGQAEERGNPLELAEECLKQREKARRVLEEQGLVSKEKAEIEERTIRWLKGRLEEAAAERLFQGERFCPRFKESFYRETLGLKRQGRELKEELDASIAFVRETCGQELALFLSQLSGNESVGAFLGEQGSREYLREGGRLLLGEREEELRREVQRLQRGETL